MMMDMLILLGLFIAILALAYFTYRNLVGLDGRLRKIENILQNAEVVTTTDPSAMPSAHAQALNHVHSQGQGAEYSSAFVSPEYIAGWGGQGPVLTVQKEGEGDEEESEDKVVELVDDLEEPEELEEAEEIDDQSDSQSDTELEQDNIEIDEIDKVDRKKDVMDSVDDILTSMENDSRRRLVETGQSGAGNESVSRGPKVTDMKDALKKAGVTFPATAKKSDLQKLMEEHHIQV
jgi:hypothetical protein